MAILSGDYEPHIVTCALRNKYPYEIRHSYDVDVESDILATKVLADHNYTATELVKFLEPQVDAKVYELHGNVVIRKLYKFSNAHVITDILIYLNNSVVFGPYIPTTNDPVIVNPISKIMLTNTCYGSTELK